MALLRRKQTHWFEAVSHLLNVSGISISSDTSNNQYISIDASTIDGVMISSSGSYSGSKDVEGIHAGTWDRSTSDPSAITDIQKVIGTGTSAVVVNKAEIRQPNNDPIVVNPGNKVYGYLVYDITEPTSSKFTLYLAVDDGSEALLTTSIKDFITDGDWPSDVEITVQESVAYKDLPHGWTLREIQNYYDPNNLSGATGYIGSYNYNSEPTLLAVGKTHKYAHITIPSGLQGYVTSGGVDNINMSIEVWDDTDNSLIVSTTSDMTEWTTGNVIPSSHQVSLRLANLAGTPQVGDAFVRLVINT